MRNRRGKEQLEEEIYSDSPIGCLLLIVLGILNLFIWLFLER